MSMRVPVSVFMICRNEEARIGTAIQSVVHWADEVIVVDSGSTDRTVKIAEELGARVLHRQWDGYGPQKRFAQDQCRNEWVLNLDADEEVSAPLATEIQHSVADASESAGAFQIQISDVLPGELRPSWHAYSYQVLRLYNRQCGQMSMHPYQDRVEMQKGEVRNLREQIYHRSFRSWEATIAKINFYSSQVANDRARRLTGVSTLRMWTEFPSTFLKIWILRRYIFRGTTGLAMSITIAYLNLLRLLKTQEQFELLRDSGETCERGGTSTLKDSSAARSAA